MIILNVSVSLVITKTYSLRALCVEKHRFLCFENCGNRNHLCCRTLFCLHIEIYALKIIFGIFFLWSIKNPIRHLFHTLRKFTHFSGRSIKSNLCYCKRTHLQGGGRFNVTFLNSEYYAEHFYLPHSFWHIMLLFHVT